MVPFPLNTRNTKSKKKKKTPNHYTDHNRYYIGRAQSTMRCWDYAFCLNALKLL